MSLHNVPFLTWAGVHGGISVAPALSVPESKAKPTILAANYAVVLFGIIIQGSTLGFVASRLEVTSNDARDNENVGPSKIRGRNASSDFRDRTAKDL